MFPHNGLHLGFDQSVGGGQLTGLTSLMGSRKQTPLKRLHHFHYEPLRVDKQEIKLKSLVDRRKKEHFLLVNENELPSHAKEQQLSHSTEATGHNNLNL